MSRNQIARRERMLEAAAELGATAEFDRVQMLDIAKRAGVAIGTLYRYFPSKTKLFAALFEDRISRFTAEEWAHSGTNPVVEIGENLVALNGALLREPRLCGAMLRATAGQYMTDSPSEIHFPSTESALVRAILSTLGVATPDGQDRGAIRLLVYSWWGVLVSCLSQHTPAARAEADLRQAAQLILARYAD
ncbi:TetR family transcriptional regulator [Nocardia sp. CA-135398]|uniref:TetR family transcriptional regulator n=1 Tax=Nocardia sp. CA-135398 TaxID=3239977 RepID=UPI003D96F533